MRNYNIPHSKFHHHYRRHVDPALRPLGLISLTNVSRTSNFGEVWSVDRVLFCLIKPTLSCLVHVCDA
eukprot:m.21026 g.21026  ORF g.21026 m.21026 type:complete len:68 (+) comp9009_c0_seq2:1342-1545(+)